MPGVENDRRVIIYPNYIDSKKTIAEGRRITVSAACESPHVQEIVDCCVRGLGLAAEYELKYYSRDFLVPGRVRIQLFKPDGTPVNADITNRRMLMTRVAALIPKHPSRSEKARTQGTKPSSSGKSSSTPAVPSNPAKSGKKGKKGRR